MTNRRLEIPDYVKKVMIKIYDSKFNVYIVGECMRKFARNRKISTYTLVTNARLKDIVELFNEHYPTLAHKNEFKIKSDGKVVIVRVFDKDTLYIDDYLRKKDFTFNAIAYTFDNYILDNFCGIQDIRKGSVKAIRNDVFSENPLKIVSAIKFACIFKNGYIDQLTYNFIKRDLHLLDNIPLSEYKDDFLRMVYTKNAPNIFRKYPNIISNIIPYSKEMQAYDDNNCSLYERMIRTLENLSYNSKRPTLAAIYLLSGKTKESVNISSFIAVSAKICETILKDFGVKTKLVREVVSIIQYFNVDFTEEYDRNCFTGILGVDIIKEIYALRIAVKKAYDEDSSLIEKEQKAVLDTIKKTDIFYINNLVVDGLVLHNMGFEGEEVGRKLIEVYLKVINNELKNSKKDILDYLNKYIKA